ncbi:YncE family protein [Kitasatospora sp. NPDC051170]|uniref:YncE family protein n=1 Tax=Kitasatospora sp. NPDC051170 TaxID=3364056 RepID=UPI003794E16D
MKAFTWNSGGLIRAYRPADDEFGELTPAAVFRPAPGDKVFQHAVAPDLARAYYTTMNALVAVAEDGTQVWRSAFDPESACVHSPTPGCALSPDGRVLWLYRPDARAGRGTGDRYLAVDAATGATLGEAELGTAGHGALQLAHPTSGEVLFDVGQGERGTVLFRASLAEGRLDLARYPWSDRGLLAMSPDGRRFVTLAQDRTVLTVHAYPGGEEVFTLTVEAFGHDPRAIFFDWHGARYLDQDHLLVDLEGDDDGWEWSDSYRIDARTGHIHGEYPCVSPLGDGTAIKGSRSGNPIRVTLP